MVLLAGVVSACQTVPATPRVTGVFPTLSPREIVDPLIRRQQNFQDLKSFVKTTVEAGDQHQTLRQVILIRDENALRLDTLSVFGQPLGVLIFKSHDLTLYDTRNNRLYRGGEARAVMHPYFPPGFDLEEIISVFSGNIPRMGSLVWSSLAVGVGRTGLYEIEARDPLRGERLRLGVAPTTLLPARMEKWQGDRRLYTALWNDYRQAGDRDFPHEIVVTRSPAGEKITMRFREPLINQGVPDDSFQLEAAAPSGGVPG